MSQNSHLNILLNNRMTYMYFQHKIDMPLPCKKNHDYLRQNKIKLTVSCTQGITRLVWV